MLEVERLRAEHPNEPDMIEKGRVLGMALTRAFGDSRWKWSKEIQEKARDRFFGPDLRESLKSPPYLTAEPVITTTEIKPEQDDFLIMASDGLWDNMTSEQAVQLVGLWRDTHDIRQIPVSQESIIKDYAPFDLSPRKSEAGKKYSLGGRDQDLLTGLLTMSRPIARRLR